MCPVQMLLPELMPVLRTLMCKFELRRFTKHIASI